MAKKLDWMKSFAKSSGEGKNVWHWAQYTSTFYFYVWVVFCSFFKSIQWANDQTVPQNFCAFLKVNNWDVWMIFYKFFSKSIVRQLHRIFGHPGGIFIYAMLHILFPPLLLNKDTSRKRPFLALGLLSTMEIYKRKSVQNLCLNKEIFWCKTDLSWSLKRTWRLAALLHSGFIVPSQSAFNHPYQKNIFWENQSQLSNLWWMANSVSKGFESAMKTGSLWRFKRYPTSYGWVSSQLPFTQD